MLAFLLSLTAAASCPVDPALRDPDGEVTILEQNLKFILTGERRRERDRLLADYLEGDGASVDVLLLSEARITRSLDAWGDGWCFYTQAAAKDGYRWAPLQVGRPPGGLAMGIRQRPEGEPRKISTFAGRRFRARPTTLAEGVLGKLVGYRKGWAGLRIDDTQLVWSHTQASYRRHPDVGAGRKGRGRAGQFDDLADDLGRPDTATLLTGDLNLLAGFWPDAPEDEARVRRAREIDDHTIASFAARTGLDLALPWFGPEARERRAELRSEARAVGNTSLAARDEDTQAPDAPVGAVSLAGPFDPAETGRTDAAPAIADGLPAAVAGDATLTAVAGDGTLATATAAAHAAPARRHPHLLGTFAGGIDRRAKSTVWDTGAAYDRVGVNAAFLERHPGTRVRPVEIAKGWLRVSDHIGLEITIPFDPPRAVARRHGVDPNGVGAPRGERAPEHIARDTRRSDRAHLPALAAIRGDSPASRGDGPGTRGDTIRGGGPAR
jgi:hypothetical protein